MCETHNNRVEPTLMNIFDNKFVQTLDINGKVVAIDIIMMDCGTMNIANGVNYLAFCIFSAMISCSDVFLDIVFPDILETFLKR
jgi:hypothetical protein